MPSMAVPEACHRQRTGEKHETDLETRRRQDAQADDRQQHQREGQQGAVHGAEESPHAAQGVDPA